MTNFVLGNDFSKQKQAPEVFCKKGVLENTCARVSFLIKLQASSLFYRTPPGSLLLNRELSLFSFIKINIYICNHQNIFSCFSTQHNFFAHGCSISKFLLGYRFMIYCRYGLIDLIWSVVMRQNSRNNSHKHLPNFHHRHVLGCQSILNVLQEGLHFKLNSVFVSIFCAYQADTQRPEESPYRSVLVVMSLTIIWPKQDLSSF